MKRFLPFLLLFFSMLDSAHAQLFIKNNSNEKVTICLAWYEESASGFKTKGWWNVEPGQTINPGLYFTKLNDAFYFHAKTTTRKWGSEYKFVTSEKAFEINNATSESTLKSNPSYVWAAFDKVDVKFGVLDTKTFTLTFDKSEAQKQADAASKNHSYYNLNGDELTVTEYTEEGFNFKLVFSSNTSCGGMDIMTGYAYKTSEGFEANTECQIHFDEQPEDGFIVTPESECIGMDCVRAFDNYFLSIN